jgi:hypothetical protein
MPIANIDAILAAGVVTGATKAESAIGMAWLRAHWQEWARVEFNRGMGPGLQLGDGAPEWLQRSATASTRPRADIVVYRGDVAGVVELKERIRGSALGQVITYAHMLQADNPRLLQVYKYVAGASILDGIAPAFESNGVIIELFPYAIPLGLAQ